jgi:hypothetical protein
MGLIFDKKGIIIVNAVTVAYDLHQNEVWYRWGK